MAGTITFGSLGFARANDFNQSNLPPQTNISEQANELLLDKLNLNLEEQKNVKSEKQPIIDDVTEAHENGFEISYKYSDEETQAFYENAADILSSEYGNIISKKEILERLNRKGKMFLVTPLQKDGNISFCRYVNKSGNIYISQKFKPENGKVNPLTLHESIHKLQFEEGMNEEIFKHNYGLVEAATESIVFNLFSKGKINQEATTKPIDGIKDFLNSSIYYSQVILLNQMSKLLNDDTLLPKLALNGDREFIYKFTRQDYDKSTMDKIVAPYGEQGFINEFVKQTGDMSITNDIIQQNETGLFARLNEALNVMEDVNYSLADKKTYDMNDINKSILKVQTALLHEVFDKRFQTVNDKKSAMEYLKQLEHFLDTSLRVLLKDDSSDFTYYKNKLSDVTNFFKDNGIDTSELKEFTFKNQELEKIIGETSSMQKPVPEMPHEINPNENLSIFSKITSKMMSLKDKVSNFFANLRAETFKPELLEAPKMKPPAEVKNDFMDSIRVDDSAMAKISDVEKQLKSKPTGNKEISQNKKEDDDHDFKR